jgi:hypothetical protein
MTDLSGAKIHQAAPLQSRLRLPVHKGARLTMSEYPYSQKSGVLIHVMNVAALLLAGLILLMTAVDRPYQLIILIPVLVLLVVYWRWRAKPHVMAGFFGLSMGLLAWILICEHIVTIDNVFRSQISKRLSVGLRLQSYIARNLRTPDRLHLEPCCDDPLTWRYQPGSIYRKVFDCETCGDAYEIMVDETGYLNQQSGLMQSHAQIDLFLAGDSVMQGYGAPSVLEWIRAKIPLSMWNLSIEGYGARQKVNALITYALPKQPKWLIVEFYAGNDLADEVRNEACDGLDFQCPYNRPEIRQRWARHPIYQTMFVIPTNVLARFADATTENLTLATTRYLLGAMKDALRERFVVRDDSSPVSSDVAHTLYNTNIGGPPGSPLPVREGQWLLYLKTSMQLIEGHYERLGAHLKGIDPKPTVILLYSPTPYEVYRGMWIDPSPKEEMASLFQRETLSGFAQAHHWRFLDLTEPLRQEVQARPVWLYGRYDTAHWSPQGTAIVASVLSRELRKVIGQEEAAHSTR